MTTARNNRTLFLFFLFILFIATGFRSNAQSDVKLSAKIDATKITVGDQARLFIEAQYNQMHEKLQWAVLPDTFNHLEIVEKGKIDTVKQGDVITLKQRLLVTGFDSGAYTIPSFLFSVIPNSGSSYTLQTDSFMLSVSTVPVDTTKGYYGIKGIMAVKSSWRDYIWFFVGAAVFIILIIFVVQYFLRNRKAAMPEIKPSAPAESLHDRYMRLLGALDQKQLWQQNQVKEYYVQLTDLVRDYIEKRFQTPAMELTTDELLDKVNRRSDMQPYYRILATILRTGDLAKFAKAQPLQHEHIETMESAKQFIAATKPELTETTSN